MKKFLFTACAIGALAAATPALAGPEYRFSGTFLPSTGTSFSELLGGGSFDGSYSLAGSAFPTSGIGYFDSFSLNLRDSTGAILLTLTQGVGTAGGYINTGYASIYGGTTLLFSDATSDYLQLVVPTGFGGTGAVLANGYSYAQIAPQNQAIIGSGVISVPEPAAWGLMLGGFGAMGMALRSRRTRVRVAYA
ncbi:PEPxxWA-CTERM sorting domain-containing protein [Sphingomonas sp. dw_22]|uniref:PEPxxWA-CTERM sorting domain-containing protein n=1 Tax=Sphingomonas sp. dw_22 TaxID=2721175 RepID=UPI001BD653CB|nr:PEPxxWA-CTERM sorting domain-containing protein [Sphingomonas sp. dw_22]